MHFPFASITWKHRDLLVLKFVSNYYKAFGVLHKRRGGGCAGIKEKPMRVRERGSFTSAKSMLFPFIVKNVAVTRVQKSHLLPKGLRAAVLGLMYLSP